MYKNSPSYESREDEKVNHKHHRFTKIMNAFAFIICYCLFVAVFASSSFSAALAPLKIKS